MAGHSCAHGGGQRARPLLRGDPRSSRRRGALPCAPGDEDRRRTRCAGRGAGPQQGRSADAQPQRGQLRQQIPGGSGPRARCRGYCPAAQRAPAKNERAPSCLASLGHWWLPEDGRHCGAAENTHKSHARLPGQPSRLHAALMSVASARQRKISCFACEAANISADHVRSIRDKDGRNRKSTSRAAATLSLSPLATIGSRRVHALGAELGRRGHLGGGGAVLGPQGPRRGRTAKSRW